MPGLVLPCAGHPRLSFCKQRRGWPGRQRVHARLRRAMPGHDGTV